MSFTVKSEKDGYVYVFQYGTDGGIVQVFPSVAGKNNRMRAGTVLTLPPKGMTGTIAGGPAGTDRLMAIVSQYPRDFSGLGMKTSDGFMQTTIAALRKSVGTQTSAGPSVFAGRAICVQPCTDEYGTALFSVDEIK